MSKHADIQSNQKDSQGPKERKMDRGTAEGCMESQHIHFLSNKLHTFQSVVRGGARNTIRIKIPKHKNKVRGHLYPHRG
jgi:hypothetical protein